MPRRIRMAVLAANAHGAPDFYLAFVAVTNEQYNIGDHYDLARAHAEVEGYQYPTIAFDQNDAAALALRQVHAFMNGETDET
ncbi:hypothetical protein P0D72_40330 [Paraburkholderia sediminicola]|uniref:hypothetical protein n=1 Tax=Paraburkholderia sediminicola TaxID=458836 RepID=UPI0038B79C4E